MSLFLLEHHDEMLAFSTAVRVHAQLCHSLYFFQFWKPAWVIFKFPVICSPAWWDLWFHPSAFFYYFMNWGLYFQNFWLVLLWSLSTFSLSLKDHELQFQSLCFLSLLLFPPRFLASSIGLCVIQLNSPLGWCYSSKWRRWCKPSLPQVLVQPLWQRSWNETVVFSP